ncbi:nuclear transport factor 2 family protein [Kordiimonas marina]|uniref:nuclear transport factor 2 family protein n=1 Tax=Kordiimonas marina TaxID=2872312 RepID=UPI001FF30864|nr:nuclear transport factor 2 family protein [Kordiimonas marina]MCJ9430273.1 nuclear transport factor 2 family protein [Kordiimonas marina]
MKKEDLKATLHTLELRIGDPAVRGSASALDDLLHDDFLEVAASGAVRDKEAVIALLAANPGAGYEPQDLQVLPLGGEAALVTFREPAAPGRAGSRKSSLWVREARRWLLRYRQGTYSEG